MLSLEFDAHAFEDLAWWIEFDRKMALRIIRLIKEVQQTPFEGIGKPEQLKHDLEGCWSRRINDEHRLLMLPIARSNPAWLLTTFSHSHS